MGTFEYFKTIIIVQLFWAFAITLLVASIPADDVQSIDFFVIAVSTSMEDVATQLEGAVSNQTTLPLLDVGALVYYSGNFLLNLMVNFVTAVPSIATLLVEGGTLLIPLDSFFELKLKAFLWVAITALYVLSLIAMILNIRSGGATIR